MGMIFSEMQSAAGLQLFDTLSHTCSVLLTSHYYNTSS